MAHRRGMMAALIACAGIAVPALAQDSVSNNADPQGAGASDALSPWVAGSQSQDFILNLTPFTSSWGTSFATAPLSKSSRTSAGFESTLMSAQTISRGIIEGDPAAAYNAWRTSGQGISSTNNDPASMVGGAMGSMQFGYAFTEFGTSDSGDNVANIIGGVVNVFPNNSCKLYVNRTVAISSSPDGTTNTSTLNIGSVDAHGNVAVRADDFGTDPFPAGVNANNIVIVDTQARAAGVVNDFGGAGATDAAATTIAISGNPTAHSTPGLIPEELGGPSYIGTNFNMEYVFNNGGSSTLAHLAGAPDQRGTLAFSNRPLHGNAGSVASAGTLTRDAGGAVTRAFSIWDVDATGAIVGSSVNYTAPAGIDDPCYTGDDFPNTGTGGWNATFFEFDHYHSQVPFNGGNSQLALGQDQAGNLLAAGIAYFMGGNQDPTNAIAVLRDSAPGDNGGGEEWALAAWNGDINFVFTAAGRGKPVLDGPGGNTIGYISTLLESTNGAVAGPSMSGCSIDALGNIWFVAPVEYPSVELGEFDLINVDDIHVTLIRAVYNTDAGEPCWDLEAVMRSGDVFTGANSTEDYLVGFIGIADSNSVSSGTFWSQNAVQDAFAGMSTLGMATRDARSTGGVLLSTSIVYDKDGDGMFSFDSELAGDGDESYNVIMYVGANNGACADLNGDGVVDTADLGILIGQFGTAGALADINCDGVVDTADLGSLIGQFGNSCN